MTFQWPELLWLLALLPLAVGLYVWLLRRRKRTALRYASLGVVKAALGPGSRWRRHLPPAVFLLGLASLLIAVARPSAVVTLPKQRETVILAMDVSGSMRAADVKPSRMAAAQAAARSFIDDQPGGTRVGIVSFAGSAAVVQVPTRDREALMAAIDRFQFQRGTAVGSGLLISLKTIFPKLQFDLSSEDPRGRNGRDARRGRSLDMVQDPADAAPDPGADASASTQPVPPGSFASAVVILLTDGQTTTGPDPIESARIAAEHGVRVYTVGVGTEQGELLRSDGWSMRVRLDEEALREIAKVTRGEYFHATNAEDLKQVYDTLKSKLVFEKRATEISALFAAAGALLALVAAAASLLWFGRIL
ncbi:MAG: VWA domain-containing protein [Burkholderiales bacterium]|nr:MAG: VWA domain-containing protein [Burkholderiales bacterium]